jgi:hypothetical protein
MVALAALAVGLGAFAAPAVAAAEEQAESGFALEASIGARFYMLNTGGTGATGLPNVALPQVGLMAGYKTGRIVLGLGLEFANNTASQAMTIPLTNTVVSQTTSDSSFLIGPEFQAALLRSADNRVELIADVALHFGHQFHEVTTSPATTGTTAATDSNFLLSYAVAPGVRFWAHPHLALQAVTGFGGQAFFDLPVNNNPANGNNSQHGIFTSFGAMGVF